MNQRSYLQRLIYTLKRRYGQPLDVYNNVAGATDLTTGVKSVTRLRHPVRRAVILPKSISHLAELAKAFVADAGRAFVFGGIIDKDVKILLIDSKDAVITTKSEFIIAGQRYELAELQDLGAAFLVNVRRANGTPPNALWEPVVYQSLRMIQRAQAEVV